MQEKINYAWSISKDHDFIYMLEGENALWDFTRQSEVVKNGVREDSWGFCQIHRGWHPEIVNDKRFFTDWRWQMRECLRLWKGGTRFYGFDNKWYVKTKFK